MNKLRENRYFKIGLTIVISGICIILFLAMVLNWSVFRSGLATIAAILSPFIYGLVMAYLLCPIYNLVVRSVYRWTKDRFQKKRRAYTLARVIASIVSVVGLVGVVGGFLALLVPDLIDSIMGIARGLPERINEFQSWLTSIAEGIDNPKISRAITGFADNFQNTALHFVETTLLPSIGDYTQQVTAGVLSTLRTMLNMLIGVIVCVYFLNGKEKFRAQTKKAITAIFRREHADEIFAFAHFTNRTFGGFINGKIIDSCIIGILCYVLMIIIGIPYPGLVSTIVGATNVIPFFGPFIGAVPGAIIICLVSPIDALYFLIMVFGLQQLDGNIIGPAILGGTTGLASFWVMFAILVGGGLFGFIGMILGVPVFAVLYYYIGRWIRSKLEKRSLPSATWDYEDFNQYDIDRRDIQP